MRVVFGHLLFAEVFELRKVDEVVSQEADAVGQTVDLLDLVEAHFERNVRTAAVGFEGERVGDFDVLLEVFVYLLDVGFLRGRLAGRPLLLVDGLEDVEGVLRDEDEVVC